VSILDGRIAIVTGAGRGIGRAHALELARQGAKVVVNDFGVSLAGESDAESPADSVVSEIQALGGEAVANGADVADFEQAAVMVQQAIDTFGGLDILVNNAGFVRDRMLVNTAEDEWDSVIRVHLKGHFAPLRHAGAYWRSESKEGRQRDARVINTSSGAGLQGSIGQTTYSAAKAGIAGMTLVAAAELGRYGVTVNAIAPVAKTRMTEGAFDTSAMPEPEDNSPVVAWLASVEAADVTGRVIEIEGGQICLEQGWTHGPTRDAAPLGGRRRRSRVARADRRGRRPGAGLRDQLAGQTVSRRWFVRIKGLPERSHLTTLPAMKQKQRDEEDQEDHQLTPQDEDISRIHRRVAHDPRQREDDHRPETDRGEDPEVPPSGEVAPHGLLQVLSICLRSDDAGPNG